MKNAELSAGDAELAVIAILLNNPDLVHSINGLRFYMFSSIPYTTLFEEIESLLKENQLPDPSLVYARLESRGVLDKVGGKKNFEFIVSKQFQRESFHEFVNLVVACHKTRVYKSITVGVNTDKLTVSNVDEYITNTRKNLDELTELRAGGEVVHIGDITSKTYEEILLRRSHPGMKGFTWGVESIDKATGGKSGGDLWVVGGRPGSGKTALILNSILEDGRNGVPALLIEREMRAQSLMDRLICLDTGITNDHLRLGVLNNEQLSKIRDSLERLKKYPIFLDTNYRLTNPFYIESTISKFHNKHGIKVVYADYVQLLTERDEEQTQEIGRFSRMFKLLANDLNICSIVISQLNREVEKRESKRPMLSDMRQSGALEEDPDFVIGLYREEYYNPKDTKAKGLMEYIVLKHRDGPTGTVMTRFDGPTGRITEA